MGKMRINIVHRMTFTTEDTVNFEALKYQQDAAHKVGLKTSLLLSSAVINSEQSVAYAKEQEENFGDEIGITFHDIDDLAKKYNFKERMFYLLPFEVRKQVIVDVFERFTTAFGYVPKAIVSYIMDARTLNFIHDTYPTVKAAITSCFEEGVKMFYGNQNQWYLFSDGGPWGAYYPSKDNALACALDQEDYCGIIGLPHLNRDMVMAITSRDDLFSSHPTNVVRAKAYDLDKMTCPYMFDFIDEWIKQLDYNQDIYYNVFVGANWLTNQTMLEESGEFSEKLYTENMEYLAQKKREGLAEDMTMSEYALWHEANVPITTPEVNKWHDIICGSKREMFWYIDPYFRMTLDGNIGGAICDIRPHIGRLEKNLGVDTPNLENMNYPFLLSCEYRGGVHEGSIHTFKINVNGKESCIGLKRTTIIPGKNEEGKHYARFAPIKLKINGVSLEVEGTYTFQGKGVVQIERKLLSTSDKEADIKFTEYHCGCHGDTTYPEDMRGILLSAGGETLRYSYLGREILTKESGELEAHIPQLKSKVSMAYEDSKISGTVKEGWLFRPFYWLEATRQMKEGEVLNTCLKIRQAD